MNLRSISIRSRLSVLVISALLLLAAVAFYTTLMQRDQMLHDRQVKVRNIVEVAHTLVANYASLASSGKLTVADSFRIGCIGALGSQDMRAFVATVSDVLDEMGVGLKSAA